MMNKKLQRKLKDLPELPGIYIFFDKIGNVLYVGKARSLKKRVRTYFIVSNPHSPRIDRMRGKIADFKYFITKSEVDALILECNLIKKYRPPYNIAYKDDKSYPFIQITKEPFPSISLVRIPPSFNPLLSPFNKGGSRGIILFGPYPKVKIVKEVMRKIRSIFPLRNCEREIKEDKVTPVCLDYHLGLCAAPCDHKIGKGEYNRLVRGLILLLKGEKKGLTRDLRCRMNKFSIQLKFEEAARLRNQLLGLEEIIRNPLQSPPAFLRKQEGGGRRGIRNVERARPLQDLQSTLNLPSFPVHIDGFDVSNISGEFATGALVVFQDGVPRKDGYRHFGIKTVEGINDVQMLAEVARRHYQHSTSIVDRRKSYGNTTNEKMPIPDLILVDGGIGQLNAVSGVLEECNLKIPVISLAKRLEEVFKRENGNIRKFRLPLTSPALHLLQYVRDEAHRFAIKYHKILRSREIKKSLLDEVPGIGEKRKQKLLKYFGSIEKIRESSAEELRKAGIPSNLSRQILESNLPPLKTGGSNEKV